MGGDEKQGLRMQMRRVCHNSPREASGLCLFRRLYGVQVAGGSNLLTRILDSETLLTDSFFAPAESSNL